MSVSELINNPEIVKGWLATGPNNIDELLVCAEAFVQVTDEINRLLKALMEIRLVANAGLGCSSDWFKYTIPSCINYSEEAITNYEKLHGKKLTEELFEEMKKEKGFHNDGL